MTLVARVVFALLVAATFSAFFVAQRLKNAPTVVQSTRVVKFFSPNGDGTRDLERISFQVREADDVTVDVVDAGGGRVRRLAAGIRARAYDPVRVTWDGKTDAGPRAADGRYRVRIALRQAGRSVTVPEPIELDTTAPRPVVIRARPQGGRAAPRGPAIVAPGQPVDVTVRGVSRYRRTRFAVLRTDAGRPRRVAAFESARKGSRRGVWDGLVDGRPAPLGTYLVVPEVVDRAGNAGTAPAVLPPQPGTVPGRPGVTVRRLAVQPPLDPVLAGQRAEFLVDSRGSDYRWNVRRVGGPRRVKKGTGAPGEPLVMRAPRGRSGAYLLEVRNGRFSTRVPFLVQSVERAPLLVVLPAISWLGADAVDDDGDGLPDTLENGTAVRVPRPLTGLPAAFADQSAPLLAFLDRSRLRYDVTSDLALARADDPGSGERRGILLAGPARWIPRPLAGRLRRFVERGGRLASFGAGALRRGVTVGRGRLSNPTQPTETDAFGARLRPVRRPEAPASLIPLADDESLGLLTGTDVVAGFGVLEESVPGANGRLRLLAGIGQDLGPEAPLDPATGAPQAPLPALTGSRLGRGTVIRVGLPEWGARLARDPQVQQITRNVADILRRATTAPLPPALMEQLGILVVAALAAGALLAPGSRGRALSMLGAIVLTPVLLVLDIADTPQVEPLREQPLLVAAGGAAALALLAALAVAFRRHPGLFAALAVAAIPFRVPIESGGTTANLLVPLYAVIGAGALAWLVPRLRDADAHDPPRANGWLERLLAATLVLYALQAVYSSDVAKALEQVVFFYVPFAVLFALLRELDWTRARVVRCLAVLVGLAVVFAAIGFVEFQSRTLLLNPKVIASNQFEAYFRVNSLFFDPNIYGRFLALVMLGLAGVLLWGRSRTPVLLAALALAVLWAGLLLTLSQSSFAALLAGLVVLAALRWAPWRTLGAAAVVVVVAAGLVLAFPGALRLDLSDSESIDSATSGRFDLMAGGIGLALDRPVQGFGAASFSREYRRAEDASSERAVSASHTIPITVAAEQGAIGLALYLALLAAALARLLRGAGRDPVRAVVGAGFVALVVHTWLYAAFLEDPVTWALLGVGVALARPAPAAG